MPVHESATSQLGIIVVNYGAHRIIEHNLRHLDESAVPGHVIVVDNYSDVEERRAVESTCKRHGWSLVSCQKNLGFGGGVNKGATRAIELGCTSLLLLNPDAGIDTRTARELLAETLEQPMAAFAPRIVTSNGHEQAAANQVSMRTGRMRRHLWDDPGGGLKALRDEGEWRAWLTGACLAVSVDLWRAADGMTDEYFLYWEDVDFSLRCRAAGARLLQRRDLIVTHDEGGTQGRRDEAKSDVYYFYNCRGRLLFAHRNVARRAQWRWLRSTPRESWRILMRGGRRQLLHSTRPLGAAVSGTLAGLRLLARPPSASTRPHEMAVTG